MTATSYPRTTSSKRTRRRDVPPRQSAVDSSRRAYADAPAQTRHLKFAAGSVFSRPFQGASSTSAWAEMHQSTATRDALFLTLPESRPHEHLPEAVRTHAAVPGASVLSDPGRKRTSEGNLPRGETTGSTSRTWNFFTQTFRLTGIFRAFVMNTDGAQATAPLKSGRAKRGQAGSC